MSKQKKPSNSPFSPSDRRTVAELFDLLHTLDQKYNPVPHSRASGSYLPPTGPEVPEAGGRILRESGLPEGRGR